MSTSAGNAAMGLSVLRPSQRLPDFLEVHDDDYDRVAAFANAIIYYNSIILSMLLTKYNVSGNDKAVALITQISPAAWRHILLNGHYTFQSDDKMIDLDALLAELELGW